MFTDQRQKGYAAKASDLPLTHFLGMTETYNLFVTVSTPNLP
jgi:hypothetical protein